MRHLTGENSNHGLNQHQRIVDQLQWTLQKCQFNITYHDVDLKRRSTGKVKPLAVLLFSP